VKIAKITVIAILCLFFIVEGVSRFYGLNDYPLYEYNAKYEYVLQPNQSRVIYRNKFSTNSFGMRSKSIAQKDSLVTLFIGDSIIYGGNNVSDEECATSILEDSLKDVLKKDIRVLNISAKSWGPSNLHEYLKEKGTFHAKQMIYVVNDGDAYDHISFTTPLTLHSGHPEKNYSLAILGLLDKTFGKYIYKKYDENKTNKEELDEGFLKLYKLAQNEGISFSIFMHASKKEFLSGNYSNQSLLIKEFAKKYEIPVIEELDFQGDESFYNDGTHYTVSGQQHLAKILFQEVYNFWNAK
jgi:hypothetical protein